MTVSSTSSRVVLAGDGTTTAWPFAFKVQQPADLVVVYTDATGSDITLSTGQYDATGFGQDHGGTVTYPRSGSGNPAIASGTTLTIYRQVAVTQPTSISNQGAMWPQVIEASLDRLTYIGQAVTDAISRSLVISPTDGDPLGALPGKTLRKNSLLGFDGNGQPFAAQGFTGSAAASSWMVGTFLPAISAPAARGILSAAGTGDNNSFTGTNTFPTQPAADNGTRAATTAYADRAAQGVVGGTVLRSSLAGLGLANDSGAPNTTLDVAAGICADSTNSTMIALGAFTKKTGGAWAAGTAGNGMGSGLTIANATWYHVFAIVNAGSADIYFDTSVSAGNKPAGTTAFRRIGSFLTDGSAHIVPFTQVGDRFLWSTEVADQAGTSLSAATQLLTLTVPSGLSVEAWLNVSTTSAGDVRWLVTSPLQASLAFALGHTNGQGMAGSAGNGGSGQLRILTDTSARVRVVASTTVNPFYLFTSGWLDRRGRDS